MKLFTILLCSVLLNTGCAVGGGGIVTFPVHPQPTPPALRAVGLTVVSAQTPLAGAVCALDGAIGESTVSGPDGYVVWAAVLASLRDTQLSCTAPGYVPFSEHRALLTGDNENLDPVVMTLAHVDPSTIPLRELAAIRGAMWPQGLGLSKGPRPGAPDNIIATDFFSGYSADEQVRILAWENAQHYTHVVVGPIVDSDGYHGIYTPNDWRTHFDDFLDILQTFYDNGQIPVIFIHPDNWTLEQTKELTPLFTTPRAQRLMRVIIPSGWEPTRYGWSSCTWAGYVTWAHDTWPNAVIGIHTVNDVDAPVGTDALCDDNGRPNGEGWQRVVDAGLHLWLVQNGPYTVGPVDDLVLAYNFGGQFSTGADGAATHGAAWHFANSIAGWPNHSAWGPTEPVHLINAEVTSYTAFWGHMLESVRQQWGNLAISKGAQGCLDGCTVTVPR